MKSSVVMILLGACALALAQPEDSAWISYYNGADGWFAFQGPQRAMKLHPADFNLRCPFQVESLKTWWYWGMGSRTDTVFTFRIYDGDGSTLLWESESLVAPSSNWTYYGLRQPVELAGDFWIATAHRLVNPYAHPYVNVDTGPTNHSYYGWPGAWTLDNVGEYCFFAFVRELYVGAKEGRWAGPASRMQGPTVARGMLRLSAGHDRNPPGDFGSCPKPAPCLLDASGRKVLGLRPGPNDVSSLAPGVYFVRTGTRIVRVSLVK